MQKIIFCLSVLALSLVKAHAFAADPVVSNYLIQIPATALSCADQANASGKQFATATGMTVTAANCQGELTLGADQTTYTLYSILITYTVANPNGYAPLLYAAVFGTSPDGVTSNVSGIYNSYASCLSDLLSQTSIYETNTGLKSTAAFCKPALFDGDSHYVLHVEGFGHPQKSLYLFQAPIVPEADASPFTADIEKMAVAAGGTLAKVVQGSVFYYAKTPAQLGIQYLSYQDTADHCAAQIQDAQTMFSAMPGPSVVRCLTTTGVGAYLAVLQSSGYLFNTIFTDDNGVTFSTFENCLSARALEIKNYQALGYKVAGAFCQTSDQDSGGYSIALFQQ